MGHFEPLQVDGREELPGWCLHTDSGMLSCYRSLNVQYVWDTMVLLNRFVDVEVSGSSRRTLVPCALRFVDPGKFSSP